MVSMDWVAVGWLGWVVLLVGVVGGWCCRLVGACGACRGVVGVGCCVIGGVAVLGEDRVLAVGGFGSGGLGIQIRGWCGWYVGYWSGVGLVGWWAVGRGGCLVWVVCVDVTLSVKDLVCDGSRGVLVEGGFVGVVGGVWHFCWLVFRKILN